MKNQRIIINSFEKKQAMKLLEEHAQLKRSDELENWNIKAQTFLVFAAMKRICSGKSVKSVVNES